MYVLFCQGIFPSWDETWGKLGFYDALFQSGFSSPSNQIEGGGEDAARIELSRWDCQRWATLVGVWYVTIIA